MREPFFDSVPPKMGATESLCQPKSGLCHPGDALHSRPQLQLDGVRNMAGKRRRPKGWEYCFKRAGVLEKPVYLTFQTEAEGDAFAERMDRFLAQGVVPGELTAVRVTGVLTLSKLITTRAREPGLSAKDLGTLSTAEKSVGTVPVDGMNEAWVDNWIERMKREDVLAPSSIRARVGAVARLLEWGKRKGLCEVGADAFRSLPNGYSQYTETDAKLAGQMRTDVERDRRLEEGEWERIMAVLDAGVLPRKQRPLVLEHVPALRVLLVLALESAMRLREMYTLTAEQVDLPQRTVFLDKTKNGDKRQVPMTSVAERTLREFVGKKKGAVPVFPWWSGGTSQRELHNTSDYLSGLFAGIFEAAGCGDLRFHDLRHEATSRFFERTTLSELEIAKITGHKNLRMLARYANLRGSSLASKLW